MRDLHDMSLIDQPNRRDQLCPCSPSSSHPSLIWQVNNHRNKVLLFPNPNFLKVDLIAGRNTLNIYHYPKTVGRRNLVPGNLIPRKMPQSHIKQRKPHAKCDMTWQKLLVLMGFRAFSAHRCARLSGFMGKEQVPDEQDYLLLAT